jgi:hypothetical protein
MTNINRINLGVSAQQLFTKENNEEKAKEAAKENKNGDTPKEVAAKDVLGFMAAVNSDLIPTNVKKSVEVAKYVNAEQTARIEDFMKAFEADFDALSEAALDEFPDITQEAASSIALAYINQTY